MLIITYISVCILFLVSFLHVYWAFGGKWATNSVIPTKAGEKAFTPGTGMTLFIAHFPLFLFKWDPGFVWLFFS